MKILVLGGSGKLGLEIIKKLLMNDCQILAHYFQNDIHIKKNKLEYIQLNIYENLDKIYNKLHNISMIINCIGEYKKSDKMHYVNSLFIKKFIETIKIKRIKHDIHWVQFSSIGIYGTTKKIKINENTIPIPSNLYEQTKLNAEEILINESKKIPNFYYTILRPSIIYGPNIKSKIIDFFFKLSKFNIFLDISKNKTICPFVDIREIALLILLIIKNKEKYINKDFNLVSNYYLSDIKISLNKRLNKNLISLNLNKFFAKFLFYIGSSISNKITMEQYKFYKSIKYFSSEKIITLNPNLPKHSFLYFIEKEYDI